MTQSERRGAALRAQAAADHSFKQQAGEVAEVSLYAGMSLASPQAAALFTRV